MAARLPQFAVVRDERAPGGVLFEWNIEPRSWAYIWVSPNPRSDSFQVEAGWSRRKGFPASYTLPSEKGRRGHARFGLAELLDERNAFRRWTIGDPDVDALTLDPPPPVPVEALVHDIDEKVRDVVDSVASVALPYFEEIARMAESRTPAPTSKRAPSTRMRRPEAKGKRTR
jgi:hypothetical protein